MSQPKLSTPHIRVVTADGTEHDVWALNPDLCAWDRERARHNWPKTEDAPFVWLTFLAWKVLTRTGAIPACTLAEFEANTLEVSSKEDETVDPTRPEAENA